MGWWKLLLIPMWYLVGFCSEGERKEQGAHMASTEVISLMTFTMVSRDCLTNGLQERGPRPEEARGDCTAHLGCTHTGREADREQSGVRCLDSFPIIYISCPITQPAGHDILFWSRFFLQPQLLNYVSALFRWGKTDNSCMRMKSSSLYICGPAQCGVKCRGPWRGDQVAFLVSFMMIISEYYSDPPVWRTFT